MTTGPFRQPLPPVRPAPVDLDLRGAHLVFPRLCSCCGEETSADRPAMSKRMRTVPHVAWTLPYCEACSVHAQQAIYGGNVATLLFLLTLLTMGGGLVPLVLWIWYRKHSAGRLMGPRCVVCDGPEFDVRISPSDGQKQRFLHVHPTFARESAKLNPGA